jgi:hypothetical protein
MEYKGYQWQEVKCTSETCQLEKMNVPKVNISTSWSDKPKGSGNDHPCFVMLNLT